MSSCIAGLLCMFSGAYDTYMDSVCDYSEEVVGLLKISGSDIPPQFISDECDNSDMYEAHDWLIKETQEKFFVRKGERHLSATPKWMEENKDIIPQIYSNIFTGFLSANPPYTKNVDCIGILGASRVEAEKRIDGALEFIKEGLEFNDLYLLTGQRRIWDHELTDKETEEISVGKRGEDKNIFETDMMKYIFNLKSTINPIIIDATPCNSPIGSKEICKRNRPNTEDTVEALLDQSDCSNISFVSRSPNIIAQYESIAKVMKNREPNIPFEVIGGAANVNEVPDKHQERAIYQVLMAFGGALFGSYERVSEEISAQLLQCPVSRDMLNSYKLKLSYY